MKTGSSDNTIVSDKFDPCAYSFWCRRFVTIHDGIISAVGPFLRGNIENIDQTLDSEMNHLYSSWALLRSERMKTTH